MLPVLAVRRTLYRALESRTASGPLRRAIDGALVALIVANAGAVLIDDAGGLDARWEPWLQAFELGSVVLFTAEYLVRLWISVDNERRSFGSPTAARLHYLLSPGGLIDLLAILPFWLGAMTMVDLRYLRLLRLFWLLKLTRLSPALQSLGAALYQERRSFLGAFVIMMVLLMTSATVMHLLERAAQPAAFGTVLDSMWWAIITLTTTGYGDAVPVTVLGRVLGGFVMVCGIAVLAMWAGILATTFSDEMRRRAFLRTWDLVTRVPYMAGLGAGTIAEVTRLLKVWDVAGGTVVMRRGEPGDCMYFIAEGEVEVRISPPLRLKPGCFFGEIALITGEPRTATAAAATDGRAAAAAAAAFTSAATLLVAAAAIAAGG